MAKKSFSVLIPSKMCGNLVGKLLFNENAWPTDPYAKLKVTKPLSCPSTEFEVTCDSKRLHRRWVLVIQPTRHLNHTYVVRVVVYEKNKK